MFHFFLIFFLYFYYHYYYYYYYYYCYYYYYYFFFFKLNSTLDTFADKSLPGKYYRDVDKSDY